MCRYDEQQMVLVRLSEIKAAITEAEALVKSDLCKATLLQLSAIRTAIDQTGKYMLERTATQCLHQDKQKVKQTLDDMALVMEKLKS